MKSARAILKGAACIALAAMVPALGSAFLHPKRPAWIKAPTSHTAHTAHTAHIPADSALEIDLESIRQWKDGVLWIDARSRANFEQEHIPSALPLNSQEWDKELDAVLDTWKSERPTVVYCGGGDCDASLEVALRLKRDAQINNIYILKGGWPAWKASQGK